jgi:D-lactate dehydrogenase
MIFHIVDHISERRKMPSSLVHLALEKAAPGRVSSRMSDRLAQAHDASHFLLTPELVVAPRDAGEVGAVMRACREHESPLTFRSAGTSLSGQAGGAGVLVDTRRHFRRVEVLDGGARVRVQPGATVRQVNLRLAPRRRKLGPDPASEIACTIGGVIANNSSGMACGTELNTYRTVESMTLVLAGGTVLDTAAPDADERLRIAEPALHDGLLELRDRVRADPASVATIRRLFSIKNTMGYALNAFLDHDDPAAILAHLVVGSEGTLAFVAEAVFRTVPARQIAATGLLVFDDLDAATAALPALVSTGFATIELLDAASLRVAQRDPAAGEELRALAVEAHAALLVEFQEEDAAALEQRIASAQPLLDSLPLTGSSTLTSDPAARAGLWHIRKGLYATVAGARPPGTSALLEDIAVPVAALRETCHLLTGLLARHGYRDAVIFGHARDGNIHFMLTEDFGDAERLESYRDFTDDLVDLVLGMGGTLKAEHGTGRVMAPFVRRQYGDELFEVMRRVKHLCDPAGVLNPGVIISDDHAAHLRNLKTAPPVEDEVDRCVECGYCEPVCPSKDLTLTPRQRIVLRREVARAAENGDRALVRELELSYRYDGVDTCAVDGMCQTACPVQIDTGDLARRFRAERRGPIEQAAGARLAGAWGAVTRLGSAAMTIADALPRALPVAATALGRAALGHETVPRWEPGLPSGGTRRRAVGGGHAEPQAVFFAACIGTMFGPGGDGPGSREALLALAERSGVALAIPEGIEGMCCGTPWKSKGLTAGHAAMAQRVLPVLWEATRHGTLPVVVDASSCAEGLAQLVEGSEAHPGLRVVDAVAFVAERMLGPLPEARRLATLALHPTCSSTRAGDTAALRLIADAIAEEVVVPDDWGCCGFAGDRGMLHPELTASATAGAAAELAECQADAWASSNRTCEIGMSRATGRAYEQILELLERQTRERDDEREDAMRGRAR